MPFWRTNFVQPGHLYSPYYYPTTLPAYHQAAFHAAPTTPKKVRFNAHDVEWRERYARVRRRQAAMAAFEEAEREAEQTRERLRWERAEEERRSWFNHVSRLNHEREEARRRERERWEAAQRGKGQEFEWRAVPEMVWPQQAAPVAVPLPVPVAVPSPYVPQMQFIPQGTPYFSSAPLTVPPSDMVYLPTPKVPDRQLEDLKGKIEDKMWEYKDKFRKIKKDLDELSPSIFFPELAELGDGHVRWM